MLGLGERSWRVVYRNSSYSSKKAVAATVNAVNINININIMHYALCYSLV